MLPLAIINFAKAFGHRRVLTIGSSMLACRIYFVRP
jgi:hypothetical protein